MIRSVDNLFSTISIYYILLDTTSALPSGIWNINIDNDPAPSPEDGAAFSEGAIRDPAYLPFQIGSIVGAYLIWIIFISVAVLTVGRRLRRRAQSSSKPQRMDVVNPNIRPIHAQQPRIDTKQVASAGIWEVTPISPTKTIPWSVKSWGSMKKHSRSTAGSVITFDDSVISDDRARNEYEMDRLYAAVAEHEAKRHTPASSPPMPSMPAMPLRSPTPPRSPLNQNPPEFQHLRYSGKNSHYDSGFLPSPPPEDDFARSPTSPVSTRSPAKKSNKPAPLNFNNPTSRDSSRSSLSSFSSFGKKKGTSVRGLAISPPMGSPEIMPDSQYLESAPLTPRYYKPGPPSPTPPAQHKAYQEPMTSPLPIDEDGRKYYFSPGIRSSRASMSTQGYSPGPTPRTATFPIYPPPSVQEEQEAVQHTYLGSSTIPITIQASSAAATPRQVPSTPLPYPQSPGAGQQAYPPQNYSVPRITSILPPPRTNSTSTEGSRRPKPAPLNFTSGPSNNSQTTLSLRTAPLPLRALRSPNSTKPESTIKKTEVTRPDPHGKKVGLMVPGTAGMVPATPYSPFYMPMTPLTPMTPSRLVTREERRKAKKEEVKRALTQDDMVVSEEDMWGEGY